MMYDMKEKTILLYIRITRIFIMINKKYHYLKLKDKNVWMESIVEVGITI